MRITYDKSADAAYIYLRETGSEDFGHTYPCDPIAVSGQINLDFDKNKRLIGIEILDASKKLPEELLGIAEIIG